MCIRDRYTRVSKKTENSYWLYCKETSTPLLPRFHYQLALVYKNPAQFIETTKDIIRNQGVLSDDGSSFVDKYSGEMIQRIDFNTDEGYTTEGFKDTGRDVLESSVTLATSTINAPVIPKTDETQMIYNIVFAITSHIGIRLPTTDVDFVVLHTYDTINANLQSESEYEAELITATKKGKSLPLYEDYKHQIILLTTIGFLFTLLQGFVLANHKNPKSVHG